MADYKQTLNLPTTAFPMRGDLAKREPRMLASWQERELYKKIRKSRAGCNQYILHDGPPYANGKIHIGHAINKILKDIIVKAKTLEGYDSPYIPGWDCHGLPIELKVEGLVGKPGVKLDAAAFREECRKYARTQVEGQMADFKRLGVIGDWEHPYLTMDYKTEADTIRALSKVIQNGHFVRGKKPVYWCLDCQSALAEAEVEYYDVKSDAIDVRYLAADEAAVLKAFNTDKGAGPVAAVIWTTTPWTLPASMAICVNAAFNYALVQVKGAKEMRLIVAEDLVSKVMERAGFADFVQMSGCRGKVTITDSRFVGAQDDPINIHGTHLKVVGFMGGGRVRLRFMHGQSYGFDAFAEGDEIDFVDVHSLLPLQRARVVGAQRAGDYEVVLSLDRPVSEQVLSADGVAVENVTWTPEVEIRGNYFARTPTRGILVTTRRKVVIADNLFYRLPMSAVLMADDARGWYESGPVADVSVTGNVFVECGSPVISVAPEVDRHAGPVHRNIRIEGNTFVMAGGLAVGARATDGLSFRGNSIYGPCSQSLDSLVATDRCTNVDIGR